MAAGHSSHIVAEREKDASLVLQRSINNRITAVLSLTHCQYNTSEDCVNFNYLNVCRIKPTQICIFSHISRNLSVLLNNHVEYKLFLRQKILTDCQITYSDRLVWSILWSRVYRWHAESARMQSFHIVVCRPRIQAYHTAQHVNTAYRMSTRSVWLLQQPPPRPGITTGDTQLISINFS